MPIEPGARLAIFAAVFALLALRQVLAPRPEGRRVRRWPGNVGFNLPWLDRMFGTCRREPGAGHTGMTVGIPQFRDPAGLRLDRLLTQPLRDDSGRP